MNKSPGSFKRKQYEVHILEQMNMILRSQVSDKRLSSISATKVELNTDYSMAVIFWDTFDDTKKNDCGKAIQGAASRFRKLLSGGLKIKHTPKLIFKYDQCYHDEKRITDLLESDLNVDRI